MVGGSPDGLVGDDGLIELKCPKVENHLLNLARGVVPSKYVPQCQGLLWVTGRAWVRLRVVLPGASAAYRPRRTGRQVHRGS